MGYFRNFMSSHPEIERMVRPIRKLKLRSALEPIGQRRLLVEQNRFLLNELRRINEAIRYQSLGDESLTQVDTLQTQASFDYQWHNLSGGICMSDDEAFMKNIEAFTCEITGLPPEWFPGKSVADIGCGAGRFTFGFLSLGASVMSCDQSAWALEQTARLCARFGDRLSTRQINLLEWDEVAAYDLVFCFGVVHHTGNTYLTIRNVARKVKPGGRLFLMVYGFPETLADFREVNSYEGLRQELRSLTFEDKKRVLIERFGPKLAHGWFDAISPRVNDLLSFEEVAELLARLAFKNIRRTVSTRNLHIAADKS